MIDGRPSVFLPSFPEYKNYITDFGGHGLYFCIQLTDCEAENRFRIDRELTQI